MELNGISTNALEHLELYNNYDRNYWELEGGWTNKSLQLHQTLSMILSASTRREKLGNMIQGI